jgi:hypothetical protein
LRSGRGQADKLSASDTFSSAGGTYPNGTHIAEVEIDPDTGVIHVVNYVIVDDFGVTLNPLLLAGQVHGGTMQGIGQALMEQAVYDADGQLVTGTFMDYALPRAADGAVHYLRDAQRAVHDQSARGEGRGRGRRHRLVSGGGECDHRRPLSRISASTTSTCRRPPNASGWRSASISGCTRCRIG